MRDVDGEVAAVAELLATARAQAPHVVPLVVGSFNPFPDRVSTPTHLPAARHIGNWQAIGDSRYMIGFMCQYELGPDRVHPNANGHHQMGDWVAWGLAHNPHAGQPLRYDADLGFYTT